MSDYKTVLDYGADASGKSDSSQAFQKMADDSSVSALIIPSGIFRIDNTVNLNNRDVFGPGKTRFGQDTKNISYITTGRLKNDGDYLFKNQGPTFDGMTFVNLEKGGVLDSNGYNSRVSNCYFETLGTAIHQGNILVNFRLEFCNFTSVGYGIRQTKEGGLNTTVHVTGCEFNSTHNGLVFAGQLRGSNIRENIFEAMDGDAVLASHLYNNNFQGNWWEGHNGHDSDRYPDGYPCVRVTESQQMMQNFASANHVSHNWQNVFELEEEGRNGGGMGGVTTDGGTLRIVSCVGKAMHLTCDGLSASRADWIGSDPMVIRAGRAKGGGWSQDLTLRTGGAGGDGGHITIDNYPENGNGGVFENSLRFLKMVDGEDKRYESLHLERDGAGHPQPGLVGRSELEEGHVARTGVPAQCYVCEGERARGLEAFTKIDRGTEGEVSMAAVYGFDNPMISVTVEDRGIVLDGITYDKGETWNHSDSRSSRWLTLHFVDRQTGQPKTPKGFWLWFNLHTC
ncbi:hypothetical protein [Kushneria phosphatilytica]|uniref:Uncharacterized protein n=1 Tax=Kushneria phosphatilytica TaxID=657387 RepID=A0A1S1NUW7_9GAMM|nr:hypothetical protein [Kushneria phosphatilytica]OHV08676.1 hypothetical protein BH688_11615 [Kushneria phosphatilytica]QEL12394.1 hypothetical protein FY550_15440 [Kushneria phosphatilytica]